MRQIDMELYLMIEDNFISKERLVTEEEYTKRFEECFEYNEEIANRFDSKEDFLEEASGYKLELLTSAENTYLIDDDIEPIEYIDEKLKDSEIASYVTKEDVEWLYTNEPSNVDWIDDECIDEINYQIRVETMVNGYYDCDEIIKDIIDTGSKEALMQRKKDFINKFGGKTMKQCRAIIKIEKLKKEIIELEQLL